MIQGAIKGVRLCLPAQQQQYVLQMSEQVTAGLHQRSPIQTAGSRRTGFLSWPENTNLGILRGAAFDLSGDAWGL